MYELDSAITAYRIATQQIETFESGLLREAESALKVAEAAYRLRRTRHPRLSGCSAYLSGGTRRLHQCLVRQERRASRNRTAPGSGLSGPAIMKKPYLSFGLCSASGQRLDNRTPKGRNHCRNRRHRPSIAARAAQGRTRHVHGNQRNPAPAGTDHVERTSGRPGWTSVTGRVTRVAAFIGQNVRQGRRLAASTALNWAPLGPLT